MAFSSHSASSDFSISSGTDPTPTYAMPPLTACQKSMATMFRHCRLLFRQPVFRHQRMHQLIKKAIIFLPECVHSLYVFLFFGGASPTPPHILSLLPGLTERIGLLLCGN